jgi:hypothetical protein
MEQGIQTDQEAVVQQHQEDLALMELDLLHLVVRKIARQQNLVADLAMA